MEKNSLDNLLKELYLFEPELIKFEAQLIEIIKQMSELQPDTKFDANLAMRIKERLMLQITENKKELIDKKTFNFGLANLNKSVYTYAVLATVFILTFSLISFNLLNKSKDAHQIKDVSKKNTVNSEDWQERNSDDFVRVGPNAFGSLAAISLTDLSKNINQKELGAQMVPAGAGGASAMTLGVTDNTHMIIPGYNTKYVYQGANLILNQLEGDVYRRLAVANDDGKKLAGIISGLNLNGLSLSNFINLKVQSITLLEDVNKGFAVNLDFDSGGISIYENWSQWGSLEGDVCKDDNCWQKFKIKIEDVPSDEELIKKSNDFIAKYNIDLSNYGNPVIDNAWRFEYDKSIDKENFYIPDTISVIYPLLAGGKIVKDQSGNYSGVRVNINLLHQSVSGLSNLMVTRYELSSYALETDFQRLVKIVEKGAQPSYPYGDISNDREKEIILRTPEFTYINLFRHTASKNEELLVPALSFPIFFDHENEYYGQRSIVVPLVKEMLDEFELNQNSTNEIYDLITTQVR